jgi:hypothetical protein
MVRERPYAGIGAYGKVRPQKDIPLVPVETTNTAIVAILVSLTKIAKLPELQSYKDIGFIFKQKDSCPGSPAEFVCHGNSPGQSGTLPGTAYDRGYGSC